MMKNTKILYTVICILAGAILTSSCKKLLNQEPRNSTYEQGFWQNGRDANSAMAGNYALLRDALFSGNWLSTPRYYIYGDILAPGYVTLLGAGDGLETIQRGDMSGNYNLQNFADWSKYYKVIAMSNIILNKMPAMTDQQLNDVANPTRFRKEIIGQAYFVRALSYFMLTRVWGDVPLVTAYEDPINALHIGRTPKADIMKQVEKDCHEAAKNLNWGYTDPGNIAVTANKGSVYALLSHLFLWRATMSNVTSTAPNMTDVNSADTTLQQLVDKGGYRLTDTAQYYKTFIGKSTEGIFEIAASEDTREGSNLSIGRMFLKQAYLNNASPRATVPPSYLSSHFAVSSTTEGWVWNEVAWVWEWKTITTTVTDTKDQRYRKNFTDVTTSAPTTIKYSNVVYRNPNQKTDAYLSNNMIIFRLADMLLLRAEVAIYKNDLPTAIRIINESKKRNGADETTMLANSLTKDQVLDAYVMERGRELFLEGHLFYDLLRTRKYNNNVSWLTTSRFNQEGFYWPVYPGLFSNNNQLVQTNYWRGKI
jgi:hypothetical protein